MISIPVFRQRERFCLSSPVGPLTYFGQEEPFDLSQKPAGLSSLRLSQSDGESIPGSSCQEEDEESLYRRSQYSPEVGQNESMGEDSGQKEEKKLQFSSNSQTRETDSGNDHLIKVKETSEKVFESCDQAYNSPHRQSYDSDSEPDSHQANVAERNQNRSDAGEMVKRRHASEVMEVTGRLNEEEDKEWKCF